MIEFVSQYGADIIIGFVTSTVGGYLIYLMTKGPKNPDEDERKPPEH